MPLTDGDRVVLQATPALPLQPIVTGTYVDTLAQDASGAWHFTERRFGIGRSGNLQQHLTIDPGATHE